MNAPAIENSLIYSILKLEEFHFSHYWLSGIIRIGLPSMKVKKFEIFQNKRGSTCCKWPNLNTPGTQTPLHHPIPELTKPNLTPSCLSTLPRFTLFPRQRPCHIECTSARPIAEVKHCWARLVLGWETFWLFHLLLPFSVFWGNKKREPQYEGLGGMIFLANF